jgi:hypothetical protein
MASSAEAQQLIIGASHDFDLGAPGPLLVIDDLADAWNNPPIIPYFVAPTSPHAVNPHGVLLLDERRVAATSAGKTWVDIIDVDNGIIEGFFHPDGVSGQAYTGYGTIAPNPARTHLLLAPGSRTVAADRDKLWVVPFPITATSVATQVLTLPGEFGTAQTHAIAFDPDSGRAFVAHSLGITAIDPPYTTASVAFTVTLPLAGNAQHSTGRSIELAPDKSLLVTAETLAGRPLSVVHAPFSAASVIEEIAVPGASQLAAPTFVPNGGPLLVADVGVASGALLNRTQLFAVSLPVGSTSTFERMVFLDAYETGGYEEVVPSPDGRFAVLSGGSPFDPLGALRIVRAPFTETGFRSRLVDVTPLPSPFLFGGRGTGMAAFRPLAGDLPPQASIDRNSITEGTSGSRALRFLVRLNHASEVPVTLDFATVDGSAAAGTDYVAASGTLTFPPGQRERSISIDVLGNLQPQSNRSFHVALSNPANASVLIRSTRDGEGLILDDDNPLVAVITTEPPLPRAILGTPWASPPFTVVNLVTTTLPARWFLLNGPTNPQGLGMDQGTGILSGTPLRPGEYTFQIQVNGDNSQIAVREYRLVVQEDRLFDDGFDDSP